MASSMLVTDFGEEMRWWQLDDGDGLAILVTNIRYRITLESGANIKNISPTSTNRHQL